MSFKSLGTVVYRKKRRLGRGKMLTLTHHFQPLPRAFSKRRPRQPRLFAGVIGLCLAFVGTSNWESKGAKRRGGSSRALAKPFMVRGVAESLAHPSGEKPSCSMAMVYGPGRLCSLLSFSVLFTFKLLPWLHLHLSKELRAGPRPWWLLQPAAL